MSKNNISTVLTLKGQGNTNTTIMKGPVKEFDKLFVVNFDRIVNHLISPEHIDFTDFSSEERGKNVYFYDNNEILVFYFESSSLKLMNSSGTIIDSQDYIVDTDVNITRGNGKTIIVKVDSLENVTISSLMTNQKYDSSNETIAITI